MDYQAQFVASLAVVDRILGIVSRRQRLSALEAEELASAVRLKLVEQDYDVFRRFEGRSSLQTYLTVVIERLALDHRISAWGKWRPSAEARRLGPTALLLERLTARDGLSLHEACQVMRTNHGVVETEAELREISSRLPQRIKRRAVDEEELARVPGSVRDGEEELLRAEAASAASKARAGLSQALAGLPPDDRLLLKLRFDEGLRVSDIARLVQTDQKALYRRLDRLLRGLRERLEAQGIAREHVADWLLEPRADVTGDVEARGDRASAVSRWFTGTRAGRANERGRPSV